MKGKIAFVLIFFASCGFAQIHNPPYFKPDTVQDWDKTTHAYVEYAYKMTKIYSDTVFTNQSHEEILHLQAYKLPPDTLRTHFVMELNRIRNKIFGANTAELHVPICVTCDKYARYMHDKHWFKHKDKEGNNSCQRLKADKVLSDKNMKRTRENLGRGQETLYEIIWSWMSSEGHREALSVDDLHYVGIGFYKQYWVYNAVGGV